MKIFASIALALVLVALGWIVGTAGVLADVSVQCAAATRQVQW